MVIFQIEKYVSIQLRENCLYWEFFWSVFPLIRTEYGEIFRISPCSIQMRENTDQKIFSNYGDYFGTWPLGKPW